jgi:hypothetical protein
LFLVLVNHHSLSVIVVTSSWRYRYIVLLCLRLQMPVRVSLPTTTSHEKTYFLKFKNAHALFIVAVA